MTPGDKLLATTPLLALHPPGYSCAGLAAARGGALRGTPGWGEEGAQRTRRCGALWGRSTPPQTAGGTPSKEGTPPYCCARAGRARGAHGAQARREYHAKEAPAGGAACPVEAWESGQQKGTGWVRATALHVPCCLAAACAAQPAQLATRGLLHNNMCQRPSVKSWWFLAHGASSAIHSICQSSSRWTCTAHLPALAAATPNAPPAATDPLRLTRSGCGVAHPLRLWRAMAAVELSAKALRQVLKELKELSEKPPEGVKVRAPGRRRGRARHVPRTGRDLMLTSRVSALSPLSLSQVLINEERVADVQGEIEGPGTRARVQPQQRRARATMRGLAPHHALLLPRPASVIYPS